MLTYKEAVQKVLDKIDEKYTITLDDKYGLDWNWINFRIKECPGWLFGAWCFGEPSEKQTICYFCQYEKDINKFKPSYSNIKQDITVYYDDNWLSRYEYIENSIEFIRKHPIRAWHEDYYGDMAECRYVNGLKVLSDWIKHKFKCFKSDTIISLCDRLAIRFVKKNIYPNIRTWVEEYMSNNYKLYIHDEGEDVAPRYEVTVEAKLKDDEFGGAYSWFDGEDEKLEQKWRKFIKRTKKRAKFFNVYWYVPFNDIFFVTRGGNDGCESKV